MKILVTGATGFVGRQLIKVLAENALLTIFAAIRNSVDTFNKNIQTVIIENLGPDNDWNSVVDTVDVIVHTAARVHVMKENVGDPLSEFRRVNVEGTLNLARQAAASGVKRFIFVSSIKVNGETTKLNQPFSESDSPNPVDPYGISKYETEIGLYKLAKETGMEVVCIRPPLVYGPGVKANFMSMMRWVNLGVPLPFGAIHNKRSLVALDNLVDLIITCIDHPRAANQTFFAGDGIDLSTTELLQHVAIAMNKTARLLPIPQYMIEVGLKLVGKKALAQRLCGSLQVDISKAHRLLNWSPAVGIDEELRIVAEHYFKKYN